MLLISKTTHAGVLIKISKWIILTIHLIFLLSFIECIPIYIFFNLNILLLIVNHYLQVTSLTTTYYNASTIIVNNTTTTEFIWNNASQIMSLSRMDLLLKFGANYVHFNYINDK